MATQLQMRSGTTLQNNIFTGAPGEITYDTEKKNLRIHDGVTVGGMEIASAGAADYVAEWQTPTEENGYTWYRKYKSGWVEQGGILSVNSDNSLYVATFAITMANTNYMAVIQRHTNISGQGSAASVGDIAITALSTTSLSLARGYNGPVRWQVSGMAA